MYNERKRNYDMTICQWCLNTFDSKDMNTTNQCISCYNNPFRTKESKMSTSKAFSLLETTTLEEILACMEDSDRYIDEQIKLTIIDMIQIELRNRSY